MYERDNGQLKEIADKIIAEHGDRFGHLAGCRIGFVFCDKPKGSHGRVVYADTEKVNDKHRALTGLDFIITFYEDSKYISDNAREILMMHELMHVGYNPETDARLIIRHDIEDFTDIITKYGTDWIETE